MIDKNKIGNQLKELRKSRGWWQLEVADKVGLSRSAISNIEAGKRALTLTTLNRFCEVYNIDISYFRKTLRNCFKYALKHDYVTKDVPKHLEVDKHTEVKEINIFTPQEINNLWTNVGNDHFDDVPLILLYTGLRISELLNIKIEDINLKNKTINISDSKTKNGIRVLPIHDKLMPLIVKRYDINNKHLFLNPKTGRQQTYANFIKNYWTLEHIRHEARHTLVTYLTKCVDDRMAIKSIVGHSKKDISLSTIFKRLQCPCTKGFIAL